MMAQQQPSEEELQTDLKRNAIVFLGAIAFIRFLPTILDLAPSVRDALS